MCKSVKSDQEEKEGYLQNGNRIINPNNLFTNINKFFGVRRICTGEGTTDKIRRGKIPGKLC